MTVPRRLPRRGALWIGDRVRHDSQEGTVNLPGDTSTRHPGLPTINVRRLPQSAA